MASGFKFDERAFKKVIEKAASDVVSTTARDAQVVFDRVHRDYSGKDKAAVAGVLRRELRRLGWSPSTQDIDGYAIAISQGTRIVLRAGRIRW